jgi:uncharacterized Ntn-hydrolase superfamily protein
MTFSILARCRESAQLGIAVSSSSPAVAARCAHVRARVGVVASQNVTDPRLGPAALDLMALGAAAPAAIETLVASRDHIAHRQLAAVDASGRAAAWSGGQTLGVHATAKGDGCVAAGNLLASAEVPSAMVAAFEAAEGSLGDRLMTALEAGRSAGGEAGPAHSAGLLIADVEAWPIVDLRVDWDETNPIGRLRALWEVWRPQMRTYVQRALAPEAAPSYGVPGDP